MRAGSAIIAGVSKLSTALKKVKVPAARMAGRISGKVTRRITPNSLEPSVLTDSSSEGSMLFKAAATIKNAKGVKIKDSTKISPGIESILNGPFSRPRSFTNKPLIKPLLGLSSITQEIETRIGGRILGTIAVNSKMRRNGALVRIVIQASVNANTSDKPEAPSPKINEFNSNGYASGSL